MNKKKMIELFIYVIIVMVAIVLLIFSNSKDNTKYTAMTEERSTAYAIISYKH